jgi:hypothetical protein
MRLIEHLAVERGDACAIGERSNDATRMFDIG